MPLEAKLTDVSPADGFGPLGHRQNIIFVFDPNRGLLLLLRASIVTFQPKTHDLSPPWLLSECGIDLGPPVGEGCCGTMGDCVHLALEAEVGLSARLVDCTHCLVDHEFPALVQGQQDCDMWHFGLTVPFNNKTGVIEGILANILGAKKSVSFEGFS